MKLKTLLLSSAAAFAVVGGAQAADLSVAEPVDYVKVCDAFGAGYWYIPGTDTCLKIGGLVRMDIKFHTTATTMLGGTAARDHSASWEFATEAHVNVTAKSMTEYGPLTAFMELRAQSNLADASNQVESYDNNLSGNRYAYLDTAYLELGMLLVGRTGSVYDYSGGFNWDWMDFDSDNGANQVRLTWAMSGFGIQLAIEDPRDRWGTNLSSSYSMPNIVGNITMSQGNWSGQLSGGFAETYYGSGFGAQIATTIKLDSIAPGDKLLLKAAWAQNQVWKFAASTGPSGDSTGSIWSAAASFQHFWSPMLSSAVTFQYFDQTGRTTGADINAYSIVGNLVWAPVTNFLAGVEAGYSKYNTKTSGTWGVKVRLERDW
jgi:hypothetical protein